MSYIDEEKKKILLGMVEEAKGKGTEEEYREAANILLELIEAGYEEQKILLGAAVNLLGSPERFDEDVEDKIIELTQKAVEKYPDNLLVLKVAASNYGRIEGREGDSLKLHKKILEIDPQNLNSINVLANSWENPEASLSLNEAIKMMERAKEIAPLDSGTIIYNLGTLYAEAGRYDRAIETFKLVLEIDPEDFRAEEQIEDINKIAAAEKIISLAKKEPDNIPPNHQGRRSRSQEYGCLFCMG